MTKSSASRSLIFAAAMAALQPDAALSSLQEMPEFPVNRFKPWKKLDWSTRTDARYLLYVEETWNIFLASPLERMSYEDAAEFLGLNDAAYASQWQRTNNALQEIAIDSKSWDCWINHYIGNDWDKLRDVHNVSWAFEVLGWNSSTWKSEDPDDWPETEKKSHAELSPQEILAAERLCIPGAVWDGYPLTEWEFDADGVSTTQLHFEAKYRPTNPQPLSPTLEPTLRTVYTKEGNNLVANTIVQFSTESPTAAPTVYVRETDDPTKKPTRLPTASPTTSSPTTSSPTFTPTFQPTKSPSMSPSTSPSAAPSAAPTASPSAPPSGGPTVGPSSSPTAAPSSSPTVSPTATHSSAPTTEEFALSICPANFTMVLLTDKYPQETSWTLTLVESGKLVAEGSDYKEEFQTYQDTMCIKYDTCYMFEIRDKWDDGICCANGQGSYAGFIEHPNSSEIPTPIPGLNGGAFETKQQHMFCLDANGELVVGFGDAIGVRFNGRHGGT